MRRIFACVLVVGIACLGGFGVMRGIAQTEAPALTPEQLKPSNFVVPPSPPGSGSDASLKLDVKAPDIVDPLTPPMPDALPLLVPGDPKPATTGAAPLPMAVALPADGIKAPPVPMLPATLPPIPAAVPSIPADVPFVNPNPPALEAVKVVATPACNRVAPALTIETIAPETAPFGSPITYEIVVKNVGAHPVSHVRVDEEFGAGTRFVSAEPSAESTGDRAMWMLGAMNAGEEKHIRVTVKPGEGDLATKPRLTYSAETATNVRVTRPNLAIAVSVPDAVQVGDEVPVHIRISNNGAGDAPQTILKAVLTDGLKHPEGNDIQALLKKLAPGESREMTLRVHADGPGIQVCRLEAMTVVTATDKASPSKSVLSPDGAAKAQTQAKFDVRQPKLALAMSGPAKCVVTAEPVFSMEVANPGTSSTEPVQLAVAFPEGFEFTTASDKGAYDAATRTVTWDLGIAAAGTKRKVTVKAKSTVAGHAAVRAVAQAGPKLNARAEAVIHAEGVPALSFEVVNLENPIEVGKDTTYEIRIVNTGTMNCTNVRLLAALSEGLVAEEVFSSVPHKVVGQTLVFDPIVTMPVKGEHLVVRVKAKGTMPGDLRFKVQLSCDQLKQPVIKEESTSFFQP